MSDSCGCLGEWFDDPVLYSETEIKRTRVLHQCSGCNEEIAIGGPALKIDGNWGEGFRHFYHHCECIELLREMARFHNTGAAVDCDFCHCIDGWREDLNEFLKLGEMASKDPLAEANHLNARELVAHSLDLIETITSRGIKPC